MVLIVHQYFNFPASEFAFKTVYFNNYVITPSAQWIFGLLLQIISVLTSGYSVFSLQLNVKYCVGKLAIFLKISSEYRLCVFEKIRKTASNVCSYFGDIKSTGSFTSANSFFLLYCIYLGWKSEISVRVVRKKLP